MHPVRAPGAWRGCGFASDPSALGHQGRRLLLGYRLFRDLLLRTQGTKAVKLLLALTLAALAIWALNQVILAYSH